MKTPRALAGSLSLLCAATLLVGCEHHFFRSHGVVASDGGEIGAWSRPVQGCSPDPLDGLPTGKSATLFTLYWDNPVDRERPRRHHPSAENQLRSIELMQTPHGLAGVLKTNFGDQDVPLDQNVCSTFQATARPGKPILPGGRPTVSGTLDLDCHVAGSHLTAAVRFTGCEY